VNVYDNTILYTDYFLTQVIAFLQRNESQRDTAMIYISDHGESLGENGLFLHAAPYSIAPEAQTHVPMIAWFSQDAYKHWELGQDCLMRSRENVLSHDNLFHSLLGLFDIQSREYDPSLDMFKPCRA
jgi:lipid A ethanolaminephosphotransferase